MMKKNRRHLARKTMAVLLCLCMILPIGTDIALAVEPGDTGLCRHHVEHTESCGYTEGEAGAACGHIHDGSCGYTEGSTGAACVHTHDAACGYRDAAEELPCTHQHDGTCGYIEGVDESCAHIHDENCGYQEAAEEIPCTHQHDENCGYQTATEGTPCNHIHDESCGYREETAGSSCTFVCPICRPEAYPAMAESGVSITMPSEEKENSLTAAETEDLLEGMDFCIDEQNKGKGLKPEDFYLAVFTALDKNTEKTVNLAENRYITAETGHSYLVVYAVYEKESGSLVAAAERTVTVSEPDDGNVMRSAGKLPDAILQKLAEEYQIYPGAKTVNDDGNEVWTAYDAADEESAGTRGTVTFPEGTFIPEDYYLYIRKVNKSDPYYPKDEALKAAVGEYNDVQCWAIHWVKVWQENGEWKYDPKVGSVLNNQVFATVKIEYLKEDARLKGPKGQRKLQVYNSRKEDGSELEDAGELTDVTASDDAYISFTYKTNRGGPYVFVNNKVYEGYVKSLEIKSMADGSAPFDTDDEAGNDSGDSNKIVRSYDVIQYNLTANFDARQNGVTAKTAEMGFEMTMDADVTAAVFDTSQMLWLGEDYTIEYLDKDGNAVLTRRTDGKLVDKDGNETTLNAIASDSTKGETSYTTGIVRQQLRGKTVLVDDNNILAANQTFSAAVQVLGAHNGSIVQPVFRVWFAGNEENYGSESDGEGDGVHLAEKVTDNEKQAEEVRVSAAARFNLELCKAGNVSYKGWFDSSTGKELHSKNTDSYSVAGKNVTGAQIYALLEELAELDENIGKSNAEEFTDKENRCADFVSGAALSDYKAVFQNIRYGRITAYGITLQVYNKTTEEQNTAAKGFKGVSLPQGSVSFDLNLESEINVSAGETADSSQYYSQLWEYNENVSSEKGKRGKNMYWASLESTKYAAWAAPYNSHQDPENNSTCYRGGRWELDDQGGYHFTINEYDLNLLSAGVKFPTHKAGNSDVSLGYNTYIGSFSAGYVQVLNVMPRYQNATLNMDTVVIVKNLEVTTVDNQKCSADAGETTGYAHETCTGDNKLTDSISLYAKGGMTKANAFGTAKLFDDKQGNFSDGKYFLGTYFWGTSYDCCAFAGQEVTLVGAARIGAGDYQIRHMNILQLFDSEALSIHKGKRPYVMSNVRDTVEGDTNILYAADPHYKDGYDTQNKDVMHYMSTVREENLVYYDSLEKLENDGYTCVGVMAELRNWTINAEGGFSTSLKIPMDVSQDGKFLGKTVGTVNTVRIWTNASDMDNGSVSWKNGVYDFSAEKNSVEGYTPVNKSSDEHYSGEVANGAPYEKTEYENGQFKMGSNTGGYEYGTSLLILDYKSRIDIEVDNGGDGSLPTFDLDKGNYIVNYRLKDIIAEREETNGNAQAAQTKLTALAKLDTEWKGEKQRIAVASSSYGMEPSSDKMKLTDESGRALDKQSVEIGSDPDNPTTVHYAFIDEKTGDIDTSRIYTIQVYAAPDGNGTQVKFELQNVTVGVSVPDITYDAFIAPEAVKDSDRIQAEAYISGTSDVRAYSETEGNMDSVIIGIIQLQGTRLVKAVDKKYIELDGVFTYTVTYTNSGKEPVNVYLYDLKPAVGDIRGSKYDGDMILREVSADLSGGGEFTAEIDFYYSKLDYETLYNLVKVFGDEGGRDKDKVEDMLQNSGQFNRLGTISSANDHEFQRDESLEEMDDDELKAEMDAVTGLYAVVKNLGGNKTLSIRLTGQTEGNMTGNLYRNIANSWLGDSSEPLTSNMVETSVLSRTISGLVWEDLDHNGVRDTVDGTTEPLVSGVTCTLFKWNTDEEKYEPVQWNGGPNGRAIHIIHQDENGKLIQRDLVKRDPGVELTTGPDGSYHFSNLAAGDYAVAFSGEALKAYKDGATVYQAADTDADVNNDGVKTEGLPGIDGETYPYVIKYSEKSESGSNIKMHTLEELQADSTLMTGGVERKAHLDLGLCDLTDFTFKKVKSEDTDEGLKGAEFKLFKLICTDTSHNHSTLIDTENPGSCWTLQDTQISGPQVTFENLGRGEYRLAETKAPDGRVLPSGQWKIVLIKDPEKGWIMEDITAVGDTKPPAFAKAKDGELSLPNMRPTDIPSSGGRGTRRFTFFGILLMGGGILVGAAALKRRNRGRHSV